MSLSPLYTYIQALITNRTAFTIHLTDGTRMQVSAGNASFSAAEALILQVSNYVAVVEESAITYIQHNGPIA